VIPSIDVKATVEQVGQLPDHTQEVPGSMDRVGWYRDGSMPGQPGNAVITGHTCSMCDGVFDRLPRLKEGAFIKLTTAKGIITYRVSSVGSVDLADFGKYDDTIYSIKGPSGLVLMTCGDWNGSTYEATTVVYAELVS
jgi:LPXTG-site transpeptidase (sortase) family protein